MRALGLYAGGPEEEVWVLDSHHCLLHLVFKDLADGSLESVEYESTALSVLLPDVLECFFVVVDVVSENIVVALHGFPDFFQLLRICSLLATFQLADGLARQLEALLSALRVRFSVDRQDRQLRTVHSIRNLSEKAFPEEIVKEFFQPLEELLLDVQVVSAPLLV